MQMASMQDTIANTAGTNDTPNPYGHFSEDGREYIITRPDTPMPWVNVLTNGDYGLTISQAGSGYSWRTHAGMNRITRWDQDLIRDEWGKYLYIRDADSGEFWSAGYQPCAVSLDEFEVRHGFGYSVLEAAKSGIRSQVTYFVPMDDPCEVWQVKLTNEHDTVRHLQLFSYFEWLLGFAPDWHREFHRAFIDTEYDADHETLLATKVMWEIPSDSKSHWNKSWDYVAFHSVSVSPSGFDADKRDFVGRNGSLRAPRSVVNGQSANHSGRWGDAVASLQPEVTLQPGESVTLYFTLGAADSREQALEIAEKYRDAAVVQIALDTVILHWQSLVDRLRVETPDDAVNLMANGWLTYQAIACRLMARTAYYQTGGAFGFRDQLQDSLTWLLLGYPERTLAQIKLHAAHQYQDGVVLHWWHPMAETGMRSDYSDDLLWLPLVLVYYLRETDDFGCLDQVVPFFDGGEATLREHCLRAVNVALSRRSERGLPLILKGDWNDGLNAVGGDGKGESIWMAHFLVHVINLWTSLPTCEADISAQMHGEAEKIRQAVNQYGWDGAWYWRASTDAGILLGSKNSHEGQIFLNAQTWSVLSGTADEDRARQAMQSAREHLYQPYGALLLAPAYSIPDSDIGYLSRYAPGIRENGGVYCHAACWAVLAERQLNGMQEAYDLWRSFCPPLRGLTPDIYAAEPYVMPGNVSGPRAEVPGQGGWTWYTGSSGWYLRALIDGVLGIEGLHEGLRVQAALPEEWDRYRIQRIYRGATYDITVRRAEAGESQERRVNGEPFTGDVLPMGEVGSTQQIMIVI
jgi:cellobiose phosphorylase